MKNQITYKYRLYPTKSQDELLNQWLGQGRFVWNKLLEKNIARYEEEKKFNFKYDMVLDLPKLKKEFEFLQAPAHVYLNKAFALDSALRLMKKLKRGFPKFKAKHTDNSGICINQVGNHIALNEKHIKIPKIGLVKYKKHREPIGKLKNITIKRDVDQWYVCCLYESEVEEQEINYNKSIGLDLGINKLAVLSDGTEIKNPKHLSKKEKQLKRQQRKLSKKKKGSNNRNKQRIRVAKLHRKIRNQRLDNIHQVTSSIAKKFDVVFVEDLSIKNMMKNRHLSKAIGSTGWGLLINILNYKVKVEKIDKFYPSTKTCSDCGNKKEILLSERTYNCDNCGLVIDRDLNAAINIHRAGTARINACGDTSDGGDGMSSSSHVSMKQEAESL